MSTVKQVHITRRMFLHYIGYAHNLYTIADNPPVDGATCYLFIYWDIKALMYCSD
jgi:hypothetical protein